MSIESRSNQYGAIFGDWHIRKLLGSGSGGKSAVFELCRENNGWQEYSALKVVSLIEERGTREEMTPYRINEYSTAVREQRTQAEQEVRLMEQLRGKTNIVDYLDHQFCDWREENGFGVDLLIRMEKLTDLRSQLRKGRLFTDREIITIGKDICRALTICHGKNILHRDIKPENIFFNADGDYKLGDFGVSRIMSNASSAMAGTAIGTIAYAAPEQFTGRYDHRVDIYSLGLVLYELMNGNRLPFATSGYATQEATQKRFSGAQLPLPANVNMRDARSEGLAKIILKATAFYSGNRYQDAREMLRDLTALSGDTAAVNPASGSTLPTGSYAAQTTVLPTGYTPVQSTAFTRLEEQPRPVSFMPQENGKVFTPPIPPAPARAPSPVPEKKFGLFRSTLIGTLIAVAAALILFICIAFPFLGSLLRPQPVYLTELAHSDKYGKLWTMSEDAPDYYYHTTVYSNEFYDDMDTPGHTTGPVRDHLGNRYTCGLHVDGNPLSAYSISYKIDGAYTTFSGVCSMSADMDGDPRASTYKKYFEIYGDGKLLFRSDEMYQGADPQSFLIDITGVEVLTIYYPKTSGPSRIATLFDGKLS